MTHQHAIEPVNEPFGEGNGWEWCDDDNTATHWHVFTAGPFGELIGAFDSREKAEAFVASRKKARA